jgi:segregation and condensation protein A
MLPDEEAQDLFEMGPQEAAEELLARLLSARRYKGAAEHLQALLAGEAGMRYRRAPVPRRLRHAAIEAAAGSGEAEILGEALGELLQAPAPINVDHMSAPRVSVAQRLEHLRALLRRGSFSFEDAIRGADRFTVATTLYALLELYRRGEADWEQREAFGEITVSRRRPGDERTPRGADARTPTAERLEVAV